jgi:hypothetical protein
MNRDDIILMAVEAGATDCANPDKWDIWEIRDTDLERFAALVAAAEREACAMECIKLAHGWARLGAWGENNEFHDCAAAIRARGKE